MLGHFEGYASSNGNHIVATDRSHDRQMVTGFTDPDGAFIDTSVALRPESRGFRYNGHMPLLLTYNDRTTH